MVKPINLVLMGLYVVLLIVGLIFSMPTLIYLSTPIKGEYAIIMIMNL
jgi:hypothetical protein